MLGKTATITHNFEIVDSDGGTVCTNLALPFGQRQVISAPIGSSHSEIVIEVIRLGNGGENGLRIRRTIADGSWIRTPRLPSCSSLATAAARSPWRCR